MATCPSALRVRLAHNPTSSTSPGARSATAANTTSYGSGPVAVSCLAMRVACRFSSAHAFRTASGSFSEPMAPQVRSKAHTNRSYGSCQVKGPATSDLPETLAQASALHLPAWFTQSSRIVSHREREGGCRWTQRTLRALGCVYRRVAFSPLNDPAEERNTEKQRERHAPVIAPPKSDQSDDCTHDRVCSLDRRLQDLVSRCPRKPSTISARRSTRARSFTCRGGPASCRSARCYRCSTRLADTARGPRSLRSPDRDVAHRVGTTSRK